METNPEVNSSNDVWQKKIHFPNLTLNRALNFILQYSIYKKYFMEMSLW